MPDEPIVKEPDNTGESPPPKSSPVIWQNTITNDLRESLFTGGRFQKDENPSNLAKSYLELEKKMSGKEKMVMLPDDKTPPQQRDEFYKKLGRPDTSDKYELKKPAMPEGMEYDATLEKEIKETAFGLGISQNQLSTLADKFNEYQMKSFATLIENTRKLNDERWSNLKIKWGETRTKENIELAKRAFDEFAPDELKKLMARDDIESDPILVDMYQKIWRKTTEDTLVKGKQGELEGEEYKPVYPDSPEMYAFGDDEESKKARTWFEKNKGYKY